MNTFGSWGGRNRDWQPAGPCAWSSNENCPILLWPRRVLVGLILGRIGSQPPTGVRSSCRLCVCSGRGVGASWPRAMTSARSSKLGSKMMRREVKIYCRLLPLSFLWKLVTSSSFPRLPMELLLPMELPYGFPGLYKVVNTWSSVFHPTTVPIQARSWISTVSRDMGTSEIRTLRQITWRVEFLDSFLPTNPD